MTLAAAMLRLMASPSTMAVWATGNGWTGEAVDERVVRPPGECAERPAHGFVGGAQDVEAVHLGRLDGGHRPGDGGVRGQFTVDRRATRGREFLGIVEVPVGETFRQDHRRRHDRPGQRTAPGLVDPGNERGDAGVRGAAFRVPDGAAAPPVAGGRGVGHDERGVWETRGVYFASRTAIACLPLRPRR